MNNISPISIENNTDLNGLIVDLDKLKTIEPAYLESIINSNWGVLSLNGLENMTPEIAKILTKHNGILSLNGITFLDSESALYLSEHHGTLFLKGLKNLDPKIASIFADMDETIILGIMDRVSTELARIFAHPRGVIGYSTKFTEQVRKLGGTI